MTLRYTSPECGSGFGSSSDLYRREMLRREREYFELQANGWILMSNKEGNKSVDGYQKWICDSCHVSKKRGLRSVEIHFCLIYKTPIIKPDRQEGW